MDIRAWTTLFADQLSPLTGKEIKFEPDRRPGAGGLIIRMISDHFGVLVMEDDGEVLLWLLDADGRTNGPVWHGELCDATPSIAATGVDRTIRELPRDGVSFDFWPPIGRDTALEDRLNDSWERVLGKIDAICATPDGKLNVTDATKAVDRFIDEQLASASDLASFAGPFKFKAAEIVERRVAERSSRGSP